LIGPEVKLTIEQSLLGNLSMERWQVIREVIAALQAAGAVLDHVLLRAAQGKPVAYTKNPAG
jgi:hypothetical protein